MNAEITRTLSPAGRELAYCRSAGRWPGVVFLGGYRSQMSGTKAMALEQWCRAHQRAYLRLDYSGHGQSSGDFAEGCIGDWLSDARCVVEAQQAGPWVLVGSSMGAWIALLLALQIGERVAGLLAVAAATDFTRRVLWQGLDEAQRERLQRTGSLPVWSAYEEGFYPLTYRLIEEGDRHLLLNGAIELCCPARLLHGMRDEDVPWALSLETAQRITGEDVHLTLIKDGDHRLSRDADLALLTRTLDELLSLGQ